MPHYLQLAARPTRTRVPASGPRAVASFRWPGEAAEEAQRRSLSDQMTPPMSQLPNIASTLRASH
jgi:hypothetical protein